MDLEQQYQEQGMRITVLGLIVVHDHEHPHILMIQSLNNVFQLLICLI